MCSLALHPVSIDNALLNSLALSPLYISFLTEMQGISFFLTYFTPSFHRDCRPATRVLLHSYVRSEQSCQLGYWSHKIYTLT